MIGGISLEQKETEKKKKNEEKHMQKKTEKKGMEAAKKSLEEKTSVPAGAKNNFYQHFSAWWCYDWRISAGNSL